MRTYTRKAQSADTEAIMKILNDGIAYLKEQGLPQWQDGHGPDRENIKDDMINGYAYVMIDDGKIVGYGTLVPGPEEAYENMTEGKWQGESHRYIAVHRIAVDVTVRGKGLAKILLHDLIVLARNLEYKDIRIDTYPKNFIMEKVIYAAGFIYRGMTHFGYTHGERKAYQLLLD
ncbi:GNAT family N-acetyltransferase [Gracilibacillus xinjiangensis]|uniref:GNAT family N-acetyltransferase n=1 Tax=Gracilibacillus xinjiangensis TaxID=1193282 RepID=A0ABV8WVF8_9BACI